MIDGKNQGEVFYFISDAHLGPDLPYPDHRENWLIEFLNRIQADAAQLFIVGDLFDFWIEYGRIIRSDYFKILSVLAGLIGKGVKVHYIAGNHDFALGPFLTDQIGIQVHENSLSIAHNGTRLYVTHGDGLIKADKGYRLLKKCLRHPTLKAIYRLLHPSLGIGLATFFSKMSRRQERAQGPKFGHQQYRTVAWEIAAQGHDLIVMGHTHHPEIIRHQNKVYCNTGDWINSFTYATFADDTLRLWRYRHGEAPVEIRPERHSS